MSCKSTSKMSPVTMSPGSSASSQSESASWSSETRMSTMRHICQPSVKSKRKPVLPGGKLQPLFKNDTVSPKSINSQKSEHFSILPQISSDLRKNKAEYEVFSGVFTNVPELQPTAVNIYLCYNVTEMRAEVDALMMTAVPKLQKFCADFGLTFQLVDPNWTDANCPEMHRYQSKEPNRVLAECQRSSLGPNFILLMGETCGRPTIVPEIPKMEFEILDEAISRNSIANGHLLHSCYVKDDNSDPPAFVFQPGPESEVEELSDLIQLLQMASFAAKDEGKLTDDVIKKYFTSGMEDDFSNGVIGIQSPRMFCLAYRRQLQNLPPRSKSTAEHKDMIQKEKGQVIGQVKGQMTGQEKGQVTGQEKGQVTGQEKGQVTGQEKGQVTGQVKGQVTGQEKGQVTGQVKGQITKNEEYQQHARHLWKIVEKYLGSTNCRNYSVKSASGRVEGGEGFRSYLQELCADFVAGVKELVLQNVSKCSSDLCQSLAMSVRLETLHHARICESKSASCHGLSELLETVRNFLRDPSRNSQPFIIHGRSGCGKSTAVASAAKLCRDWFSGDCVTVVRFLGTTNASSNIHDAVISIVSQICLAYSIEVPDQVEEFGTLYKALSLFRATLDTVSKNHAFSRPLFIFLDGINQLRPYSECLEALWAVKNLPPNVHVILSSIKEYDNANFFGALVTLVTNPQCMAEVNNAIKSSDVSCFVQNHLRNWQRKLSDEQEKAILSAVAAANYQPMYLSFALREATKWRSTLSNVVLPSTISEALISVLERLEKEFGESTIRYFAAYLLVSQVGILTEEMVDLLSLNREVMQEGATAFPVAMVMTLKHRLEDFLEERLIFGRSGFGWSHRAFRNAVADRYNIIIDGAAEDQLQEDMANFTLKLHEHFANIYLAKEDRSNQLTNPSVTSSTADHGKDCKNSSALVMSVDGVLRANRLAHHLRVLMPIEGSARVKKCLVFNYNWLQSRLTCSGVAYTILRDVLSFYNLSRHLVYESVIEDTYADIGVVYEFLQLALKHISKDPGNLAVEVLGRLREVSELHSGIAHLVKQAEEWLQKTDRRMLIPLSSVWTPPCSLMRHTLAGPTHFLGYLRDGEVAVLFSEEHGIDVWRLQTGELLHRFGVHMEQSINGILTGHMAEFVILTRYSHVNRLTGFDVWSTETGILLLSSNFQREFEAVALDEDDQLMAVATLVQSEQTNNLERCILGVAVLTKDIVFRLPLGELHGEGVGKLMFVQNVKRETNSIVSFGKSPSQDLGFWDLETGSLDFSLDLSCTPNHVCFNADHKMIACGSSVSGMIVVVNLAGGTIDLRIEGDEYKDFTDIETRGDGIFVATAKGGVDILSISQNHRVRVVNVSVPGHSTPTKLLVTGRREEHLFVGYDTGTICMFDISSSDTVIGTLNGHKKRVNSLSITRHGQLLSAADDGTALVWNYRSLLEEPSEGIEEEGVAAGMKLAAEQVVANGNDDIRCFVVTSDEQRVITGSGSGSIQIWDIKSGVLMKTMLGTGEHGVDHLCLASSEHLLIGHCILEKLPHARILRIWDLETSEIVQFEENVGDRLLIYCSAVTPSGDRLVTIQPCKDNGQIGIILAIYDLTKTKSLSSLICNIYGKMDATNLRIVGFSSPSETMTTNSDKTNRNSTINVAATSSNVKTSGLKSLFLVLDYFPVVGVSFFFTFTICGDNADAISMDSHDPVHIDTLNPECSAVGPNEVCITGSTSGRLLCWNVRTQVIEGEFMDHSTKKQKQRGTKTGHVAHEGPVTCIGVDFKKGVVVSGGKDWRVKIWNLLRRELVTTFARHQGDVLCVSPCLANSLLLSTSTDETLCVLKLGVSAERLSTFHCHGSVRSVVMTTDKQRVVALLTTSSSSQFLLLRSVNI